MLVLLLLLSNTSVLTMWLLFVTETWVTHKWTFFYGETRQSKAVLPSQSVDVDN